jgi:tRNA modification GTPase
VSQRVLESVCAAGARPAAPGEFTKRAFLSGRLDLAQAEAIADLIGARTEAARRMAWSQLDGQLSTRVTGLREAIVAARALCEATLDFADEDIPELTTSELAEELGDVRAQLASLSGTFERARVRYEGARVAVVGRPNVGKSSLLNALAGKDRALVTAVAGTTRDVIEVSIAVDGVPITLMDTAGLRESPGEIEAMGIERSRGAIADSACILAVFDRTVPLGADDGMVADAVRGRRVIAVLNKSDLPSMTSRSEVAALLGGALVVETSAVLGDGIPQLARAIGSGVAGREGEPDEEVVIYRVRHRDAVRMAMRDVESALSALSAGYALELVASDLTAAAAALDGITGEVSTEDVLDRVFAEFCIGK